MKPKGFEHDKQELYQTESERILTTRQPTDVGLSPNMASQHRCGMLLSPVLKGWGIREKHRVHSNPPKHPPKSHSWGSNDSQDRDSRCLWTLSSGWPCRVRAGNPGRLRNLCLSERSGQNPAKQRDLAASNDGVRLGTAGHEVVWARCVCSSRGSVRNQVHWLSALCSPPRDSGPEWWLWRALCRSRQQSGQPHLFGSIMMTFFFLSCSQKDLIFKIQKLSINKTKQNKSKNKKPTN